MLKLLDMLFGCTHKRYTFPMSSRGSHRSEAATVTGMYVVCLDCGKEFPYDWRQMKILVPSGERTGSVREAEVAKRVA